VQKQKEHYNKSKSKVEKKSIAIEIVKTIQSSGGRFLIRPGNSFWIKASDQKAVLKASQALREGAPIIRKMLEQSSDSSTNNTSTTQSKDAAEKVVKKAKTVNHPQMAKKVTFKNTDVAILPSHGSLRTPPPALSARVPSIQSETKNMPQSTPQLLGNPNLHENYPNTMPGNLGFEQAAAQWHAFPNDNLANLIFGILSQQPTLTPFGRFLQDMLLPQQNSYTTNLFHPQWRVPKKVGDGIPHDIIFKMINATSNNTDYYWTNVTTKALFENKRIVLFACPAAYNRSCTESHAPEYQHFYDEIISNGIDDVYCISVNDALVMSQWFKSMNFPQESLESQQHQDRKIHHMFSKVKMLPDGTGHFTKMMGMLSTWDLNYGFGDRSWRYSAVINNCKIEQLFMEGNGILTPNANIPIIVSDAHTMLKYLKSVNADDIIPPLVINNDKETKDRATA